MYTVKFPEPVVPTQEDMAAAREWIEEQQTAYNGGHVVLYSCVCARLAGTALLLGNGDPVDESDIRKDIAIWRAMNEVITQ